MALKINNITPAVRTSKLKRTPLFKEPSICIEKINYDGTNIVKNSQLNFLDKFIFKTLDIISPIIDKHSIFKRNVLKISEKILRSSNDI